MTWVFRMLKCSPLGTEHKYALAYAPKGTPRFALERPSREELHAHLPRSAAQGTYSRTLL